MGISRRSYPGNHIKDETAATGRGRQRWLLCVALLSSGLVDSGIGSTAAAGEILAAQSPEENGVVGGSAFLAQTQDPLPPSGVITALPAAGIEAFSADSSDAQLAKLDKVYGLKGWNIPFPSFADSVTQDYRGWRSALASKGFGYLAYDLGQAADNILDRPRLNGGQQAYWGQKASAANIVLQFLNYDVSQFGIPDGQVQLAAVYNKSTWQPYLPNSFSLYRLAYYQTFFQKKVEIDVGYMGNAPTFVGTYVGGQLANPFGPSASIPVELGLSSASAVQPTAWLKYHPTRNVYDLVGVARSISPTSGAVLDDHVKNPSGLDFNEAGAKAVYVNELGFNKAAGPGSPQTWLRAGAIYNNTLYHNFVTGRLNTKTGFYALGDWQLLQLDPASASSAYRGIYGGVSAMYTSPKTSIFSRYYEARLYATGLSAARPRDTIIFVYNHQVLSRELADNANLITPITGVFDRYATNSITGTYTAKLLRGVFVTAGLGYTDHPSFAYLRNEGSALNVLASTFVVF